MSQLFGGMFDVRYNSTTKKPTIFYKTKTGYKNVLSAETPDELYDMFIQKYKQKIKPFDIDFKKFNFMKGVVKRMKSPYNKSPLSLKKMVEEIIRKNVGK